LLLSINISNYTLVEALEIDFDSGTTAITGETGAGKSLVLDALAMALGDRADIETIRHGKDRAEISATFDVSMNNNAKNWLMANSIDSDINCIIRRIYTKEGRSRGYINGQPSTMTQLKELGEMLTDIHSQHEHQSLLRRSTHRRLLDEYGEAEKLAGNVKSDFTHWKQTNDALNKLTKRADELEERKELLTFQVNELDLANVSPDHIKTLEEEQQTLSNADQIVKDSHSLLRICDQSESSNLRDSLNKALSILGDMKYKPEALNITQELLQNGLIQVEEAINEIQHHIDRFEADPQRLHVVEEELSDIFQLARKHRINPDQLLLKKQTLRKELKTLVDGNENINTLTQDLSRHSQNYKLSAKKLSVQREKSAKSMSKEINEQLARLSMEGAEISIELSPLLEDDFREHGLENIEFLLTTTPGQSHKSIAKVASGGELSRVSLAINVVAAGHSKIPTLVFDEVDVGIGGRTADVVGQLLKKLGENGGQVISVTHQPQVAAHADHHYLSSKTIEKDNSLSLMMPLNKKQRIKELARMLGGAKITQQTLSSASELLDLAST
jgi:DNA repair protein RecN (Recombination protein N)